ncbi:tRNA (cytidine/uridine-2'-O-)-methyltransferase TrmJ [Terasakiella brassicae]|uniref:tRNA (Cytidine/uridine-2'-O-)-methyltransferase TrmJ n=1 Tax=Terasakiella brassicae TaxID=1634917 RepID=A0A917BY53_9PROT|nr:RNA methyltransferase [Terasakiella brassicae]GGF61195.1 tRNA (cytidine/uridine-2'-O-)-methyltransferase TrmJ [Terasakiella brassicae]
MAGTDRRRKSEAADFCREDAPAIILVEPQLGENIGMVARAMLNCGLIDLRIVNPREGWDRDKAEKSSSGATMVLERARFYTSTADAVADLEIVYATTARPRDMVKPMVTPRQAATESVELATRKLKTGVLFGKEAKGLHNDDVALADAILHLPLNPAFASLNLAQAVLLIGYEWFTMNDETEGRYIPQGRGKAARPATKDEVIGFYEHLERELDASGFLRVEAKRPSMVRNIRNIFARIDLTLQEVQTLRGIVAFLANGRSGGPGKKDQD